MLGAARRDLQLVWSGMADHPGEELRLRSDGGILLKAKDRQRLRDAHENRRVCEEAPGADASTESERKHMRVELGGGPVGVEEPLGLEARGVTVDIGIMGECPVEY